VTTVVDAATGIPSMIHDVQTIANGKASVVDKLLAAGDLALNVVLDVSMIVGIGEAARAAYFGIRLGIDLAAHIGEDAAAHAPMMSPVMPPMMRLVLLSMEGVALAQRPRWH